MANEAVLVQQLEDRLFEVTVADGTAIAKGAILKFGSDPNTAVISAADGDLFAGILAVEKVASDGQTRVPVWRKGVFDILVTASTGSATLGKPVKINGANQVTLADDDTVANSNEVVGIALETGSAGEVINVLVGGV